MKKSLLLAALLTAMTAWAGPFTMEHSTNLTSNSSYTFDSSTGTLTLNWGEFNKENNWGSDVTPSAVKSVTASSEVSFTGNCYGLFGNFNHCENMDLNNVNTSGMTNANSMFDGCSSLTSLNLTGWNTQNVTDMSYMFNGCSSMTTIDVTGWNTDNLNDMSYQRMHQPAHHLCGHGLEHRQGQSGRLHVRGLHCPGRR